MIPKIVSQYIILKLRFQGQRLLMLESDHKGKRSYCLQTSSISHGLDFRFSSTRYPIHSFLQTKIMYYFLTAVVRSENTVRDEGWEMRDGR
jgi:hypothetical protein